MGKQHSPDSKCPYLSFSQTFSQIVCLSIPNDLSVYPLAAQAALSMVGERRLEHVHALVADVLLRGVRGDVAECGCWRGGVAALAAAVISVAGELASGLDFIIHVFV